MRLIICLIPLLCGCSNSAVRCDAHLQPINPPAANAVGAAAAAAAAGGAAKAATVRRAP